MNHCAGVHYSDCFFPLLTLYHMVQHVRINAALCRSASSAIYIQIYF